MKIQTSPITLFALLVTSTALLAQDAPTKEPEELKRLRQEYTQKREAALKPINASYKQKLELLINSLTQRNQLDSAVAVRKELENLTENISGKTGLRHALLQSKWSWTGGAKETDVFLDFREDGTVSHRGMNGTWTITGPNEIKLIENGGRTLILQFDARLESYRCVSGAPDLSGRRSGK